MMKMRGLKTLLLLFLCARMARAEVTLSFAAQVEDEALAEDAILLVHCLSDRSGRPWEFTGEARGPLWLEVHEESRQLKGTYHKDGKDLPFAFRAGGADETCDRLEPAAAKPVAASLAPPAPALGSLAEPLAEESEAPPRHAWIWAAVGAAAVGGLLYWRARQPSFRTVEMH